MQSTARRYLAARLAAKKSHHDSHDDEHFRQKVDAYQAILSSNLPDVEKQPDRVAQEVLTLLVGGSATTMRVMLRVLFHVITTPKVLRHLRRELDAIMPVPDKPLELEVLEQQQYLVSHWNTLPLGRGIQHFSISSEHEALSLADQANGLRISAWKRWQLSRRRFVLQLPLPQGYLWFRRPNHYHTAGVSQVLSLISLL